MVIINVAIRAQTRDHLHELKKITCLRTQGEVLDHLVADVMSRRPARATPSASKRFLRLAAPAKAPTTFATPYLTASQRRNALKFGLSPREIEVLELLLSGDSNRKIGDAMGMTESTTKGHCSRLYRILKVVNRAQLISRVHSGLLDKTVR
jgi:DNA-binding CsgD family transcriptional regulator